jgi:hypothetical protein
VPSGKPIKDGLLILHAALWRGNDRLDHAFHNNPTLTAQDASADVALLQEALDTVFRAMPLSKRLVGTTTTFDGRWGSETFGTVRDYQVARHIEPPGGFEAGRRTLGALDAELVGRGGGGGGGRGGGGGGRGGGGGGGGGGATPGRVCGPNVGGEVARAWSSARSRFVSLSFGEKLDNCRMLVQPFVIRSGGVGLNQDAFDTWGLFQNSAGWTRVPPWHGSCGSPGSSGDVHDPLDPAHEDASACSNTVQIGSDCWLSGTPNYGLFGIAMSLCSDFTLPLAGLPGMAALHQLFSLPSTMALVGGYKALKGDNIVGPEKWAIATYLGGPSATASGGNRATCSSTCPGPAPPPFLIVWEPHMPRSSMPNSPPYMP